MIKWSRHKDPNRKKQWEARTWIDRKRKSRFFATRLERDQFIKQNENFTDNKYEKIKEILVNIFSVSDFFRFLVINLAVPSAVFKAMFPVKPSVIITFDSPFMMLFPSM